VVGGGCAGPCTLQSISVRGRAVPVWNEWESVSRGWIGSEGDGRTDGKGMV
jgi:hypothetical protein